MKNMARKIITFSRMIKYSPSVSYDINNVTGINAIVKTCSVKITPITSSFRDICIDKQPLPTDVFDDVNTPIPCVNTTDIDNIERSSSYSLKDIAEYSTIPCENIRSFVLLGDENLNNTYVSRDTIMCYHHKNGFVILNNRNNFWNNINACHNYTAFINPELIVA